MQIVWEVTEAGEKELRVRDWSLGMGGGKSDWGGGEGM